ncbi:MAG: PLP-dependent aminotransferase family protein [Chloroflexi bacterium]|nr:PLP-dependent aminotransferase family protein [Chloroflexota bacterium]
MFNANQLSLALDRDGEEPIYRQLIRHIRSQIDSGSLPSGARLPASRELADALNISRISVVNAYAELRSEGYLSAHAGRGTFVSRETTPERPSDRPTLQTIKDHSNGSERSLRELMRMSRQAGVISFGQGAPPGEMFPVQYLRDAINTVLDRDGANALGYEAPEGYGPLRSAVRDYVSALGIRCTSSDILITGGTQQALDMVIQSLLSEGETLVTEDPTYIGMLDIGRTRRINVVGIPIDNEGIRLDILESFIIERQPRLIYVMPSFQNPTGTVMPLHRRRQLINLAHQYGVTILEDGVFHEFRFEGEHIPPLRALDEYGVVIHASGFTKMLLPGIRVGYVISDSKHHQRLVRMKQSADISTPGLNQRAIHIMLERGIMALQLERNNREFRRRRDVAVEAARKYFPSGTHFRIPLGGVYLWVHFPPHGPTAAEMYLAAIQKGVGYAIGNIFYAGAPDPYTMRLNYGLHKPADIERGFKRLGEAWRDCAATYAEMDRGLLL